MTAIALVASVAHATPIPLSAIPLSDDSVHRAPGVERVTDVRVVVGTDDLEWAHTLMVPALDRPVCVVADPQGQFFLSLSGEITTTQVSPMGDMSEADGGSVGTIEIDRLMESDPPFLERLVIDASSPLPRAVVQLRGLIALLRIDGPMSVYAYRTKSDVLLFLPQGFASPADAFRHQHGIGFFWREQCGLLAMQLSVAGGAVTRSVFAVQPLPEARRWAATVKDADPSFGQPKHGTDARGPWIVNASLSKTARDPEALLSVTITTPDDHR